MIDENPTRDRATDKRQLRTDKDKEKTVTERQGGQGQMLVMNGRLTTEINHHDR